MFPMASPTGLWSYFETLTLHFDCCYLGFLEPEGTVLREELFGGGVDQILVASLVGAAQSMVNCDSFKTINTKCT